MAAADFLKKVLTKDFLVALLVLGLLNVALFWKFYFKEMVPIPGDLLVSYYFPWNSGGFSGFDPWVTRKGVVAMDAIRMQIPWRSLVVEQLQGGHWPLWNPYNFSGTPLLANFQSSVFFPGTLLLIFLPFITGYISNVVLLPFLFTLFLYFWLKSLKISNWAAIFGAVVLSCLSYVAVWAEQLIIIQSLLFLPLALWAVNKYLDTKARKFLLTVPFFLAFCIFGGHPQTFVYAFIIFGVCSFYRGLSLKNIFLLFLLSFAVAAVQLLPSLELYVQSAREVSSNKRLFFDTVLPGSQLATIFAPDFYGNPATFNFRGWNYDNFTVYFGIVALVLGSIEVAFNFRKPEIRPFILLAIFGLVFATAPFAYIFNYLHIPVLSSGYPSRLIFLFEFGMGCMAAFSLNDLISGHWKINRKMVLVFVTLASIYVLLWLLTLQNNMEWLVSRRNLTLPSLTFLLTIFLVSITIKMPKLKLLFVLVIIGLAILEATFFFTKYQPFSPAKFIFPKHQVFSFLQNRAGINRFFGVDRAYIDNNFATYYQVYATEGYDPLFIKRYAELAASSKSGQFSSDIPFNDVFVDSKESGFRNRLFDLLGVKVIVDKTDDPAEDRGPDRSKFPEDMYDFTTQLGKYKFYDRKTALPRAFLVGHYEVENDPKKILSRFYDPDFPMRNTIILDKNPDGNFTSEGAGEATIAVYQPNKVVVQTNSPAPKLLFLSDSFYGGWEARVDGITTSILRADYSFRAVPIPKGEHYVVFEYKPFAFQIGLFLTLSIAIILGSFMVLDSYLKRHA